MDYEIDPRWLLVEDGFVLPREHEVESLFTVGNGATGTRGSLEEGSDFSAPATFVAGVFLHPEPPGAVPELMTFPNWAGMKVWVNGSMLSMKEGDVLEHRRILDLKHAILHREWRQSDPNGRITRFRSLRVASLADRRLLLQQVLLTAENYCMSLTIESSIELEPGLELPAGWNHESRAECPNLFPLTLRLSEGKAAAEFCIASQVLPLEAHRVERRVEVQARRLVESYRIQAGAGAQCEFRRFVSVSRVGGNEYAPRAEVHARAAVSAGISPAVAAHKTEWQARWQAADVLVDGDEPLQKALRFTAYHLISAGNPEDSHSSIAARAMTGHAYKGHVFWDTEIYMLPFFTLTHPATARALLEYRYHTLPAAREKACKAGYRGAMYAWESADTGEEVTPAVAITPMGEVLPVRNGEMEVHITADIAYGIWQYWKATGDDGFLLNFGAEIILEAARFWAGRGNLEADGLYHIRHVIGPDEYHEDVDDNAFTNLMAAWNLRRAAKIASLLENRWSDRWSDLRDRLHLTASEVSLWPKLADVMASGFNSESLLFEQFTGYFSKEQIDLSKFEPRSASVDLILGHERVQQTNIVKQADVLMAIYLLWDELRPEVRKANFLYYEPRTAHGSSLSPSIHALLAARLGEIKLAQRYLQQSAEIDLSNNMGNAAGGVHAAAIGGLWQAVVFGFAGLQRCSETVMLSPNLLPHWRQISFPMQWRDNNLYISIQHESLKVKAAGPDSIQVLLANGPPLHASPDRSYVTVREQDGWAEWQEN
ncbi:MAG TPA: glycosyl hydrolase family 65 protein [Candidatus Angelobacter sp.]|nr:glycosyl hydrolase family 65 protein [Candidatus Angelobacter sp.]